MAQETIRGGLGKLLVAWSNGVFLCIKGLIGEVIVSDSSGVYKSRTVHRRPISDGWDIASSDLVRYAPWKVNENGEKADGEVLVAIKLTDEEIADQIREKEFDLSDAAVPRRFKLQSECWWNMDTQLVAKAVVRHLRGNRHIITRSPAENEL